MKLLFSISFLLLFQVAFSQTPLWQWGKTANSSAAEQALDVTTDPVTGDTYICGFFDGDISGEYILGTNGTPDMSSPVNEDGFVAKYDQFGTLIWAFDIDGAGDQRANGIAMDAAGNIYVTGNFENLTDFTGITNSVPPTRTSNTTTQDVFLAKYDSNGDLLWIVHGDNPDLSESMDVDVNDDGVYISGSYNNSLLTITDGLGGIDNTTLVAGGDARDIFVAAFNLDGSQRWLRRANSAGGTNERTFGITCDNTHVYITGTIMNNTTFYDPLFGNQVENVYNPGYKTMVFASYSEASGGLNWVLRAGTTGDDFMEAHGIQIYQDKLYITGGVDDDDGDNLFFPGMAPFSLGGGASEDEIFVCQIDTATQVTDWINTELNNAGSDARGEDVIVDGSGNIIITGYCEGTTNFNAGNINNVGGADIFIAAYDNTGTGLWVATAGSSGDDWGTGISYDNNGSYYISGHFGNDLTMTPQPILINDSNDDIFIGKLSPCDADFTYAQSIYCHVQDADPTPTINGDAAGVFTSSPAGLSMGAGSGIIDIDASAIDTFMVFYTSPLGCIDSFEVTIDDCWEWADGPNTANYEAANSIAVDEINSFVYVGGILESAGVYADIPATAGGTDGFVAKYNFAGVVQWAFNIGGDGDDEVTGVTVDPITGNIYVTGYYEGVFTTNNTSLDGFTAGVSGDVASNYGNEDAFTACYDANGALLWQRTGGGTGVDKGLDIAVNGNGVYITGFYDDTASFGNVNTSLPANTKINNMVIAYDLTSGAELWMTELGSSADDYINSTNHQEADCGIVVDDDSIYVLNYFIGSTFEIYDTSNTLSASITEVLNGDNFVVTAFTDQGAYGWATMYDGSHAPNNGMDITQDCDGVYVIGSLFMGDITPGGTTIISSHDNTFISALDKANGNEMWVRQIDSETDHTDYGLGIDADSYGNLYVVGRMKSANLNIEVPTSVYLNTGATTEDVFLLRYQNDGTFQDFERLPGTGDDFATDVSVYKNSEIFICGISDDNTTFYPITIPSIESENIFVAKKIVLPTGTECCPGPTITSCQPNVTVTADGTCNHTLGDYTGGITAVDVCLAGLDTTQTPAPGTVLAPGTHTITIKVEDGGGKSVSCQFDIIVEADVNPVVVNCGDILVGQNTAGAGNTQDTWTCDPTTTSGEDIYYQITVPAGNYLLGTKITNATDADDSELNVFWINGSCPLTTTCLSSDQFDLSSQDFVSNNQNQLLFNAAGPGTFFFIVDSENAGNSTFDIEFNCIVSGIEFDETNCGLDTDNNGVHTTVNASTVLEVEPCETVSICNILYTQNINGGEWLDTVVMELGPCYTNITNMTPTAPGPNGFYNAGGTWNGVYNAVNNTIQWGFDYSTAQLWGDGVGGVGYACRDYTFCFDADISATCIDNDSLKINMLITDDAVNGAIPGVAQGFDYAFADSLFLDLSTPDWSLPATSFCQNETDPTPTISGTMGGTFSSTAGLIWFDQPNGIIDLSASTPGVYNITYSVGQCPEDSVISVTITALDDPFFDYPQAAYCDYDSDPVATNIATGGGTFTGPAALVFLNTSTGLIDLSASTAGGPYTIKYVTAGICPDSTTFDITINQGDDPFFDYPQNTYCSYDTDPVATNIATGGGTFSGPVGVVFLNTSTGLIDLDASTAGGPYTIKYVTAGICPDSTTFNITINQADDPFYDYPQNTYCSYDTDPVATNIATGGGTFSGPAQITFLNTATGLIDLSASTAGGPYAIKYVTAGICPDSLVFNITIVQGDDPAFNYPQSAYCSYDTDPAAAGIATGGGVFSGPAQISFLNTGTGLIDLDASTAGGPYAIKYVTAGICPDSTTFNITINQADDPFYDYPQNTYCSYDTDPVATNIATGGGTFSGPAQITFLNTATGLIDLSASTAGGPYAIKYVTAGICPDSLAFNITIVQGDDPAFNYPQSAYCSYDTDPAAAGIATGGGVFSGPAQISFLNTGTGLIDLDASTAGGPYAIKYVTAGICPDSTTFNITINQADDPFFDYPQNTYCSYDTDPVATNIATGGGTFSGPASVVFLNPLTGLIDLDASTAGGPYAIKYVTAGTCPDSLIFNITIVQGDDPAFNYPQSAYCSYDTDPAAAGIATGGGVFSGPAQISFLNTGTGLIDLDASTAGGPYTIKYATAGICPDSTTFDITINQGDDPFFDYQVAYCSYDTDPVATNVATTGGTFTGPVQVVFLNTSTGLIDLDASTAGGPYTIKYVTAGICPDSTTFDITINQADDPFFDYQVAYCSYDTDPVATNVATTGGTFTGPVQVVFLNTGTGLIDLDASTAGGPYTIKYVTAGICPDSTTFDITINPADNSFFDYPQTAYCLNGLDPIATNIALTGGTFSTPPQLSLTNASNGLIDLSNSQVGGPFTVSYLTNGTCPTTSTFDLTIDTLDDASFSYITPMCGSGTNPLPNGLATPGGTFSELTANVQFISTATGQIDLSNSNPGVWTIDYLTNATCPNSSSLNIEILPVIDPIFWVPDSICLNVGAIQLDDSTNLNIGETDLFYSYGASGSAQLGGPNNNILQSNPSGPGSYFITHVVDNGVCVDSMTLEIHIIPNFTANWSNPDTLCIALGTYNLNDFFNGSTDIGGVWSGIGVFNDSLWNVGALPSGSYSISYAVGIGQCTDTLTQDIFIKPDVDSLWTLPAMMCSDAPMIDLNLTVTGTTGGIWTGPGINNSFFDPFIAGEGLHPITYNVDGHACSESFTQSISVLEKPILDAGLDDEICDSVYSLSGSSNVSGLAYWYNNGEGIFSPDSSITNATVTVSNFGVHRFYWYADQSGICSTIDSVEITFYEQPIANAGLDQNLDFLFETNLSASSVNIGVGEWSVQIGDGYLWEPTDSTSFVDNLNVGNNEFLWTVENGNCPIAEDEMRIFVNDIWVPQVVTPNGDNSNDYFVVKGIENAQNKVQIFNRWGQIVFETENYQNDWDGYSNNGTMLEDETYFYVITVDDLKFNGYVVLKR